MPRRVSGALESFLRCQVLVPLLGSFLFRMLRHVISWFVSKHLGEAVPKPMSRKRGERVCINFVSCRVVCLVILSFVLYYNFFCFVLTCLVLSFALSHRLSCITFCIALWYFYFVFSFALPCLAVALWSSCLVLLVFCLPCFAVALACPVLWLSCLVSSRLSPCLVLSCATFS
jgi:hypothetical protein